MINAILKFLGLERTKYIHPTPITLIVTKSEIVFAIHEDDTNTNGIVAFEVDHDRYVAKNIYGQTMIAIHEDEVAYVGYASPQTMSAMPWDRDDLS